MRSCARREPALPGAGRRVHRARGRRLPRLRARSRGPGRQAAEHRSPRHQPVEHHVPAHRRREAARLRDRQGGGRQTPRTPSRACSRASSRYVAPERIKNEPLDGRVDLFGLGVVLWEMLVGPAAVPRQERARDAEQRARDAGAAAVDANGPTSRRRWTRSCCARSSATATKRYPTGRRWPRTWRRSCTDGLPRADAVRPAARVVRVGCVEEPGDAASVTPELLASLAEDPGGRQPADAADRGGDAARRSLKRGTACAGAAAVTAALAGLLLVRGGGGSSLAHERSEAARRRLWRRAIGAMPRPCPRAAAAPEPAAPEAAAPAPAAEATAEESASTSKRVAPPPSIVAKQAQADRVARGLSIDPFAEARGAGSRDESGGDRSWWSRWWRASSPARAASPEAEKEARAHFQAGEAHFKAGAFDEALASTSRATTRSRCPASWSTSPSASGGWGDLKKARATYQKFVLVAPDSPLVPQVRSMIAEIDGLLEKEQEKSAAEPDGDAKPAGAVPPARPGRRRRPRPCWLPRRPSPPRPPRPSRRATAGGCGARSARSLLAVRSRRSSLSTGGTTTIHDGSLATLRR